MEHPEDTFSSDANNVYSRATQEKIQSIPTYLTFDDVLLLPQSSDILPSAVSTKTQFTRNISLNIPFVSAAMDTVTESAMAIAMAKSGGIGVLHRSLTPELQADEVRKVKRASSLIIREPIVVQAHESVAAAQMMMRAHNISGLPVVDEHGSLVGMLTSRDMRASLDSNAAVSESMTTTLITAAEPISIDNARALMVNNKIEKLPLISDGRLTGLMTLRDITQTDKYPNANTDNEGHLRVGAAVGTDATTEARVDALVHAGVDVIIVDTAHGHSARVIDTAQRVRKDFPEIQLVVGNIATAAAARDLLDIGVDAIKVGIGPDLFAQRVLLQVWVHHNFLRSWMSSALRNQPMFPLLVTVEFVTVAMPSKHWPQVRPVSCWAPWLLVVRKARANKSCATGISIRVSAEWDHSVP